ncbi:MAG: cupin domain-containing protein [Acidimicrobiia bacterium]
MASTIDEESTSAQPGTDLMDLAANALLAIGSRIRQLRGERDLTLQALAEMTGLSASLLSLVERGKTSPSIGTLVAIAHAFDVHMTDLVPGAPPTEVLPVLRHDEQRVYATPEGVTRRILRDDRIRGLEVALNEYGPGGRSADSLLHHAGYEYGVVIEGTLTVEMDGDAYELRPGDSIAYDSTHPHRILNRGRGAAKAMWVNLDRS